MSDPKRKISASIPISLLDQLQKIGYFSPTEAVLTGFELLVNGANLETKDSLEEYKKQIEEYKNEIMEYQDKITEYKKEVAEYKVNLEECIQETGLIKTEKKSLTGQIEEYKKQKVEYCDAAEEYKKGLIEYKNNIEEYKKEVTEYAIRIDSLQTENKIFQEYNTTLKQELEDTKELHRNYMLQMQTLITQKQIEAPGAKKPWWRFW
jgi:chromosome segregation ATPase